MNARYVKEKWAYAFWSAGSDLECSGINIICKLKLQYLQGLIEAIISIKIHESGGHIRQLKHKPIVLLTLFCSANVTMKLRIKPSIPSYSVFGINAYCPFREWNADLLPENIPKNITMHTTRANIEFQSIYICTFPHIMYRKT